MYCIKYLKPEILHVEFWIIINYLTIWFLLSYKYKLITNLRELENSIIIFFNGKLLSDIKMI